MFRRETFDIFEEPLDEPGLIDAPVSLAELAPEKGSSSDDVRSTEDSPPVAAFTATDRPSSAETGAADPRRFSLEDLRPPAEAEGATGEDEGRLAA